MEPWRLLELQNGALEHPWSFQMEPWSRLEVQCIQYIQHIPFMQYIEQVGYTMTQSEKSFEVMTRFAQKPFTSLMCLC